MNSKLVKLSHAAALGALLAATGLAQTTTAPPQGGASVEPGRGRNERRMGRRGHDGRGGGERGERGEGGEQRALRRLDLTDAQRQQMRDIEARYAQGFRADREEMRRLQETRRGGGTLTPEQQERARKLREELRANVDRMRGEIQSILTPEQREQMRKQREEMKERRRERAGGGANINER